MFRPGLSWLMILFVLATPSSAAARDVPPFVSPEWLVRNGALPGLRIVDVRSGADYRMGHIPGAGNAPVNSWAATRGGLLREMPDGPGLKKLLGSIGAGGDSKIVVVGRGDGDFDRADAIRVAWTILSAGLGNVAVLDGGHSRWLREKRPVTVETPVFSPGDFRGKLDTSRAVSKKHVLEKMRTSALVDSRTPEVYFGITTEPWATTPGHIAGAVNLPAPWIFGQDGLVRSRGDLESMAKGVVGEDKGKEIITYCGVGVYASAWSYILTELLGYRNVKVYDGSMQEWIMDPAGPTEIHRWK